MKKFSIIATVSMLLVSTACATDDRVFTGKDGVLFLRDEIENIPLERIQDAVSNISKTVSVFQKYGTKVVVLLVPTKISLMSEDVLSLPNGESIDSKRYDTTLGIMKSFGLTYIDLRQPLLDYKLNGSYPFWMMKDSHWSPMGAYATGISVGKQLVSDHVRDDIQHTDFIYSESVKQYDSDLYKLGDSLIKRQSYKDEKVNLPFVTKVKQDGLLDSSFADVILCGSSYSVKPFPGLSYGLMMGLSADIINNSYDGGGIWMSMEMLTKQINHKGNPPKLIIWEFPERYLDQSAPDGGIENLDKNLDNYLKGE